MFRGSRLSAPLPITKPMTNDGIEALMAERAAADGGVENTHVGVKAGEDAPIEHEVLAVV